MPSPSPASLAPTSRFPTTPPPDHTALMLAESQTLFGGPPRLLQSLAPKDREILLGHGRRRVLDRGDLLFRQGESHEGIFLIESGRMRVFYTAPSGREITLAYWYPGNFVGGPDIFGTSTHMWSGVAERNSAVVFLPGQVLRTLVGRIPALAEGLIDGLVFKGKCYSTLAQMLGTRSVTERLIQLLLHLADTHGVEVEGGTAIAVPFTHADLAHLVGATRQWVTISLKRMQATGIVESRKGQIVILDPLALVAMGEASN